MEDDTVLSILEFLPKNDASSSSNNNFNFSNGTEKIGNFSIYIFPPENEGSPFEDCASIILKSDLQVLYI